MKVFQKNKNAEFAVYHSIMEFKLNNHPKCNHKAKPNALLCY